MATSARIGSGSIFAFRIPTGTSPGPAFTPVAEVNSISPPSLSRDIPDATHMASGDWREFIAGLKDGGEVTLDLNWLIESASHGSASGLLKLWNDGVTAEFRITFGKSGSPAKTWTFGGIIQSYEGDLPVDDKQALSVTIKVSGAVTFA